MSSPNPYYDAEAVERGAGETFKINGVEIAAHSNETVEIEGKRFRVGDIVVLVNGQFAMAIKDQEQPALLILANPPDSQGETVCFHGKKIPTGSIVNNCRGEFGLIYNDTEKGIGVITVSKEWVDSLKDPLIFSI